MNENHSLPPEENYNTKKTEVYRIDDFWSSDILEFKDYGVENNGGFRYVLVAMDNFSKFC